MPSVRGAFRTAVLGAAVVASIGAGPALAAEPSLFSREPDAATTLCGGRCSPTLPIGSRPGPPLSFDSFSTGRPGARRSASAARPRPRAFDAVEGTALDPLLNKTYDLNSPKTVPALSRP